MNDKRYFKHDTNARNDMKVIQIRKKYGLLGYGIYFCILEMLCCDKRHTLKTDFDSIAFDLKEDQKIIEDIVKNYGLFVVKKNCFYSQPFKDRMKTLDNIREGWAKGGKNRWKKKDDNDSIYREFQG